jgi:hypothetical protein
MEDRSDKSSLDGGPAFPRTGEGFGDPKYDAPGMSLRDWFTGQALSGLVANPRIEDILRGSVHGDETIGETLSRLCNSYADALLATRTSADQRKKGRE